MKVHKPTWQLVISSLWRWCPSLQLLLYCCSHFWTSEVLPQPFLKQIFIVLFCLKKKIRNWTLNNYLHISVHDNLRKEKPPRGCFPSLLRHCYPVHKYPKRRENKHSMQNIPDFLWGKHPYPHPIPQKNPYTYSLRELVWIQWQKLSPNKRNCNGYKDGSCLCQHLFVGGRDRNTEPQQN